MNSEPDQPRRVIDDPAELARIARMLRIADARPCPDIATSGAECDDCAARRRSDLVEGGGDQ